MQDLFFKSQDSSFQTELVRPGSVLSVLAPFGHY